MCVFRLSGTGAGIDAISNSHTMPFPLVAQRFHVPATK